MKISKDNKRRGTLIESRRKAIGKESIDNDLTHLNLQGYLCLNACVSEASWGMKNTGYLELHREEALTTSSSCRRPRVSYTQLKAWQKLADARVDPDAET